VKATRVALAAIGLAAILSGCVGSVAGPSPSAAGPSASAASSPTSAPTGAAATSDAVPSPTESSDRPPAAALMAEGGDPVEGQLGTYLWGSGGSDSPWLPGARIAVGAGEPLAVSIAAERAPVSWSARFVPASAGGPAGATPLGSGQGSPRFAAPDPGTWTVEVHLVFAQGEASYFWRLDVD
jgi:hypothetical protein